ncbi:MAG: metallophosphoesterase [Armatimonadetes bacterium]|nr:metallophosphoesterase [Armatimonadota bacterium]
MGTKRNLRILHLNDLHGHLTEQQVARIQSFKTPDCLIFDSGDAIKTGNLGIPLRQEPVWNLFSQIPLTASTIGNRETHVIERVFNSKIAGAAHPILCANMIFQSSGKLVLPASLVISVAGIKVGILGVSVPMVTEKMVSKHASEFIWTDPIAAAIQEGNKLRADCDVVIALTHIGMRQDLKLAETGAVDLIFGGHSHTVLEKPELHGSTWVAQGGSHARFLGVYDFDVDSRMLEGELKPLK